MQTRIDKKAKSARYWFDSLAELARYVNETERTWIGSTSSERDSTSASWDLDTNYAKAWEYARNGWLEGAKQAQEALKAFTPSVPAPDSQTDFYGYRPHVPRFCAGAPDSMIRAAIKPDMGAGRVLTLIVPVNALGSVDARNMRNFGLGVAQYVNQLESDGIRCEVIGAICSNVSGWRTAHAWRIKSADQPLDLAVMAFSIGHPAMFRRIGFALRERCAAPRDYSYGSSVATVLDDVVNAPSGAVILNGMRNADSTSQTPAKALAYIERQIERALANPEAD